MKNWSENYKKIMKATESSDRIVEWRTEDKQQFLMNCEKIYGLSTKEMIIQMEASRMEASPDFRRWYRFAKELQENT